MFNKWRAGDLCYGLIWLYGVCLRPYPMTNGAGYLYAIMHGFNSVLTYGLNPYVCSAVWYTTCVTGLHMSRAWLYVHVAF